MLQRRSFGALRKFYIVNKSRIFLVLIDVFFSAPALKQGVVQDKVYLGEL
jgi:hypothetical protein